MNRRIQSLALLTTIVLSTSVFADKTPQTEQEKFSYAVGVQISTNLMRQNLGIDPASFVQAVDDVLNKKDMKVTQDEMQQVLVSFQQKEMEKQSAQAAVNKTAGEKFLADNRIKPGIKTTASGLQYKIIKEGNGKKPTLEDEVVVNYEGSLIDGQVFDSSYQRGEPLTIKVNGVIPGWQELLPMMPVGSKWQVFIPAELAYGERSVGDVIGPNSTLVFDVELISIK